MSAHTVAGAHKTDHAASSAFIELAGCGIPIEEVEAFEALYSDWRMTPCPLCRILAGELPSSLVLENDLVVAILDIHPANPGHTLVMPRRHVEFFTDLTPTEVKQLALAGQRVAAALKRGFDSCEAVTFSLAEGVAAGQDVPHTHLHVVPRRTHDGFGWRAAGNLEDRETLDATASRLRAAMDFTSNAG